MAGPGGRLHGALILSPIAAGRLRKLDLAAVASAPGVVAVLGPRDIPGKNYVAPVGQNEPLFAFEQIDYAGQPLAMVVAETLDAARHATERALNDNESCVAIIHILTPLHTNYSLPPPPTLC